MYLIIIMIIIKMKIMICIHEYNSALDLTKKRGEKNEKTAKSNKRRDEDEIN